MRTNGMVKWSALVILMAFGLWTATPVSGGDPISVSIISPKYDSEYLAGDAIVFAASVKNSSGLEIEDAEVVWVSHLDGEIGRGAVVAAGHLSNGIHRITLDVTDRSGIIGSDTVKIKITSAKSEGRDDKAAGFGTGTGGESYVPNPFN